MQIKLSQAKFRLSAASVKNFPQDRGAEIAFCGRSNAGKSSAINALCQQKNLARTSKTPGRTQMINFFQLDGDAHLVDLPGYGFAKAPKQVQQKWHRLMEDYLIERNALCGLVLLMDIRHPLMEIDWTMIRWSKHYQLPLYILLTKVDKVKRNAQVKNLTKVCSTLEEQNLNISVQIFSATKLTGVHQAQEKITSMLQHALLTEQ